MLRSVKRKILQIEKAGGIEIIFTTDEKMIINCSYLRAKNNKIIKIAELANMTSIEELASKIDISLPVSLIINGKGILTKKVGTINNRNIIQSVLPNANPNDFYFETKQQNDSTVVTIIRKEQADKILLLFKKNGFKIIGTSFGFSVVRNILPLLKTKFPVILSTTSMAIGLNENGITELHHLENAEINAYDPAEYTMGDQYVKSVNILSFGAAIGALTIDIDVISDVAIPMLNEERNEYRYFRLFRAAGVALLIFTMSVLLISFLLYNNYFSKNKYLANSNLEYAQNEQQLKTIENNIKAKERFLERSGWNGNSHASLFADRIAAVVPGEIQLTSLQIFPQRSNSIVDNFTTAFKQDTILAGGICNDASKLNDFMTSLKMLPQFKEVSIKTYSVKKENDQGVFFIEIATR
jgi:Tfp pilus assembly protein PilN